MFLVGKEYDVILYSTHCPRCKVLEAKLKEKQLEYTVNDDVEQMQNIGIESVPVLSVDGELLDFSQSVKWVNAMTNKRED